MKNEAGKIEAIKSVVNEYNVETKLYKFLDGKRAGKFGVRVYDLDACEVVGITVCIDMEQAEAYYKKAIEG